MTSTAEVRNAVDCLQAHIETTHEGFACILDEHAIGELQKLLAVFERALSAAFVPMKVNTDGR